MGKVIAPSIFQETIFDFIKNKSESLVINAVAGSGKTTTIVEALNRLPSKQGILLLSFNKSIAQELTRRVPSYVSVSTFNGIGDKALRSIGGVLDTEKTSRVIREKKLFLGAHFKEIVALVGLAKNYMLSAGITSLAETLPDKKETWSMLYDSRSAAFSDRAKKDEIIEKARLLLINLNKDRKTYDFDDQLYWTVLFDVKTEKFNTIFVDEAQDLSPVQVALIKKLLAPGGRVIAVGDKRQAIYGFRGADHLSLEKIKKAFDCAELPLSTSYRCASSIVRNAQVYNDQIQSFEGAPEGEVTVVDAMPSDVELCSTDAAMIARTNFELLKAAIYLLKNGIGFKFLGFTIGDEINVFFFMATEIESRGRLGSLADVLGAAKNILSKDSNDSANERLSDIYEILLYVVELNSIKKVFDLKESFRSLTERIKGQKSGITLATIHKSKGLEFEAVYFLGSNKLPLTFSKNSDVIEQEYNLIYVAITRAKTKLVHIHT